MASSRYPLLQGWASRLKWMSLSDTACASTRPTCRVSSLSGDLVALRIRHGPKRLPGTERHGFRTPLYGVDAVVCSPGYPRNETGRRSPMLQALHFLYDYNA